MWKESRLLAQEFRPMAFDRPSIMELCSLIPNSKTFKMNISTPRPFRRISTRALVSQSYSIILDVSIM